MDCCSPSPEYEAREKKRMEEEEAAMNMEVNVNGAKLKVKDLFTDYWAAKDFVAKLNLLNKSAGGKALLDMSPASLLEDDKEEEMAA